MSPEKTWLKILDLLKSQISPAYFRTFFGQTLLGPSSKEKLTILVSSAFIKGEIIRRYDTLIKDLAKQIGAGDVELVYEIDSSKFPKRPLPAIEDEPEFEFGMPQTPQINTGLNPKYNLESFVVGLTNNLAYAAAQAVVQNPGVSYNPLFVYGQSGVGKTHLMQAIGNELIRKNPSLKLVYASSERFMVDMVDSIQTKRTSDFRRRYRSCDILLIDDIQFIAGKDSTQEEFFHTFNELQSKSAQIVLTSDHPPHEIPKLESRLSSRFQGGLMVDIQLPDFDTRVAILKAKLKDRNEHLPEECLRMIAEMVESNTRELEGRLVQIIQTLKLMNLEPTPENVKNILSKSQSQTQTTPPDSKKILDTISSYFNLKISDLTGPRRQKGLVLPRQIAMFILYEDCKIPQEKVGQILGGRDHTTVLHGVEKIRQAINRDREVQRLVIEVRNTLIH
ncbi:MAG: chromosomal replication initiator protein DnaA [Candidatus Paceibacterales bacterium]